eukprot:1159100-Pelagomonas_calceolata.AAC.6
MLLAKVVEHELSAEQAHGFGLQLGDSNHIAALYHCKGHWAITFCKCSKAGCGGDRKMQLTQLRSTCREARTGGDSAI